MFKCLKECLSVTKCDDFSTSSYIFMHLSYPCLCIIQLAFPPCVYRIYFVHQLTKEKASGLALCYCLMINTEWFVVAFALRNKAGFSLETENAFQRSQSKGLWKPHNTNWRQVKKLHHTILSVLLFWSCLFCPPAVPYIPCPAPGAAKTVCDQ